MKKQDNANRSAYILKVYLAALVISFVICWILLIMGALLITYAGVPKDAALLVTLISIGAASVVGGYFCAAKIRCRGFVFGALFGVLLFLVIYILGIACFSIDHASYNALQRVLIMVLCGSVGGVAGVNRRQGKR